MQQINFSDAEFANQRKRMHREVFLAEMDRVVPWARLMALIEPVYPKAGTVADPTHWRRCCGCT